MQSPVGRFRNPVGIEMLISQKIVAYEDDQAVIAVVIEKVSSETPIAADQLPQTGKKSLMRMDPFGRVFWVEGQAAWQGAEYSMMRFPEEPISPGNHWDQQVEDARGCASPFFTRYTFAGLSEENEREAEFRTELFTGNPDDAQSQTTGSGRFCFDLDEGWITSCDNIIDFQFSMPFPENPRETISTKTSLQIEMSRIK
ncbi:MAG: hypothetical protein ACOYXC_18265 [Candidatus Rifleibacteriota bacterium]